MNIGKYAHDVLRFGVALPFLWFGMTQLISPHEWVSFIPQWLTLIAPSAVITPEQVVLVNGGFQTLLGSLVALGFFVRFSAFFLFLHLFVNIFTVGYTTVAVRDIALAICTLSLALFGSQTENTASRTAPSSPKPLF